MATPGYRPGLSRGLGATPISYGVVLGSRGVYGPRVYGTLDDKLRETIVPIPISVLESCVHVSLLHH